MHKNHFRAKKNDDIITTKPDKGSGAVLLNKSDKINEIPEGQSKFKSLGESPAMTA